MVKQHLSTGLKTSAKQKPESVAPTDITVNGERNAAAIPAPMINVGTVLFARVVPQKNVYAKTEPATELILANKTKGGFITMGIVFVIPDTRKIMAFAGGPI